MVAKAAVEKGVVETRRGSCNTVEGGQSGLGRNGPQTGGGQPLASPLHTHDGSRPSGCPALALWDPIFMSGCSHTGQRPNST